MRIVYQWQSYVSRGGVYHTLCGADGCLRYTIIHSYAYMYRYSNIAFRICNEGVGESAGRGFEFLL